MAGGVSVAASHTKKLVKFTLSIFRPRFNSSKCKTAAKMAVARIKLLRNKREVVVKQMRRDIALLLQSGQDATARIRVEHVIREQNVLAANEFIELFCELVVARLSIISKRRECPSDLKEGIASLIFASPRCSEIPELVAIRRIFEKKFGRDFVSAAVDLRPNCGVNRMLIDKLSIRTPPGELKLKVMKEIAKEYQIQWDTSESEKELLKAPEELIEGPRTFVSATSLPFKPTSVSVAPNKPSARSPFEGETGNMQFKDTASAAGAAAESAKKAIAAAQAAAHLANRDFNPLQTSGLDHSSINHGFSTFSGNLTDLSMLNDPQVNHQTMYNESQMDLSNGSNHLSNGNTRSTRMGGEHIYRRHSYNETRPVNLEGENISSRQSYNALSPHSDIKFDESDCDEEIEMERLPAGVCRPPPDRPPPPIPSSHVKTDSPAHQVHPKLPDYDALAARFEALKHRKS